MDIVGEVVDVIVTTCEIMADPGPLPVSTRMSLETEIDCTGAKKTWSLKPGGGLVTESCPKGPGQLVSVPLRQYCSVTLADPVPVTEPLKKSSRFVMPGPEVVNEIRLSSRSSPPPFVLLTFHADWN